MKLQAVFWDYPQFQQEDHLLPFLRQNSSNQAYYWILARFLEHGRVIDTLSFFSLKEIASNLHKLKTQPIQFQKMAKTAGSL